MQRAQSSQVPYSYIHAQYNVGSRVLGWTIFRRSGGYTMSCTCDCCERPSLSVRLHRQSIEIYVPWDDSAQCHDKSTALSITKHDPIMAPHHGTPSWHPIMAPHHGTPQFHRSPSPSQSLWWSQRFPPPHVSYMYVKWRTFNLIHFHFYI